MKLKWFHIHFRTYATSYTFVKFYCFFILTLAVSTCDRLFIVCRETLKIIGLVRPRSSSAVSDYARKGEDRSRESLTSQSICSVTRSETNWFTVTSILLPREGNTFLYMWEAARTGFGIRPETRRKRYEEKTVQTRRVSWHILYVYAN